MWVGWLWQVKSLSVLECPFLCSHQTLTQDPYLLQELELGTTSVCCLKNMFPPYLLQDDIMSFEAEKQAVYLQVYRPVYFQLVDVLLHKAQFPSDEEYASWSSDEKEQFRIYRCVIVYVVAVSPWFEFNVLPELHHERRSWIFPSAAFSWVWLSQDES